VTSLQQRNSHEATKFSSEHCKSSKSSTTSKDEKVSVQLKMVGRNVPDLYFRTSKSKRDLYKSL